MIFLVGDGALTCRPRRLLTFFFMADIPSIGKYEQTKKGRHGERFKFLVFSIFYF
jgi:hypothetical protein